MSDQAYMAYTQNMYQEYTQIIKSAHRIHFFSGKKRLNFYDAKNKIFDKRKLLLNDQFESKTFRVFLHESEGKGDIENNVENLMILNYNHKKACENKNGDEDEDAVHDQD